MWSDIPGWFDWQWLYDEAIEQAKDGDVIVELGVAFGRSVAYLARKAIDAKKRITIYAVDPWIDDWTTPWSEETRPTWGAEHAEWARAQGGPYNAFVECMRTHAREELEFIKPIRAYSWEFALMLQKRPQLVFIDGDHRHHAVVRDIMAFTQYTKILAGHDYSPEFPGVVKAVDEWFPNAEKRGTTWVRR